MLTSLQHAFEKPIGHYEQAVHRATCKKENRVILGSRNGFRSLQNKAGRGQGGFESST